MPSNPDHVHREITPPSPTNSFALARPLAPPSLPFLARIALAFHRLLPRYPFFLPLNRLASPYMYRHLARVPQTGGTRRRALFPRSRALQRASLPPLAVQAYPVTAEVACASLIAQESPLLACASSSSRSLSVLLLPVTTLSPPARSRFEQSRRLSLSLLHSPLIAPALPSPPVIVEPPHHRPRLSPSRTDRNHRVGLTVLCVDVLAHSESGRCIW
ncbi:hypothetical protein BJY59DRAFT_509878 [Rhodotorula toruloides]